MSPDNDATQRARITLLEHCTSQMQGYETIVLTLFIGFFGGVASLQVLQLPRLLVLYLLSLGSGLLFGGVLFCVARFAWYGKLASWILFVDPTVSVGDTLLSRLSEAAAKGVLIEQLARRSIRARTVVLGDTGNTLRLLLSVAFACIIFAIAFDAVFLLLFFLKG